MTPIGFFQCQKKYPYEAPRQGACASDESVGYIQLTGQKNFEQALEGLEQFSHLWVIFQFHNNEHWKPKVLPPRGSDKKVGVFATRSPYRPNPIGMSCVELVSIDGLNIYIRKHDLLDGTPVLDLKPYLAYCDAFPKASTGWLQQNPFAVIFSPLAAQQLKALEDMGITEYKSFLLQQLESEPTNSKKKRVHRLNTHHYEIAYRTWRAKFIVNNQTVDVLEIYSGYNEVELDELPDPYSDKTTHRNFNAKFNNESLSN